MQRIHDLQRPLRTVNGVRCCGERHFACQKATEFSKATAGKWTGGVLALNRKTG